MSENELSENPGLEDMGMTGKMDRFDEEATIGQPTEIFKTPIEGQTTMLTPATLDSKIALNGKTSEDLSNPEIQRQMLESEVTNSIPGTPEHRKAIQRLLNFNKKNP